MAKTKTPTFSLQPVVSRVALVHLGLIFAFSLATIVFDTWNLFTAEAIKERWLAVGFLLIANVAVWFVSRQVNGPQVLYKLLAAGLALADIIFISLQVSNERGMASNSVALYAVPIIVIAAIKSRRALMAVSSTTAAAYVMTITSYFSDNYGEGLKIELYGNAFFYAAVMVVIAGLLWAIQKSPR